MLGIAAVQSMGFFLSVDQSRTVYPTLGLTAFLIVFVGAFVLAWPIAYWITETVIRKAEFKEQGPAPRAA